MLKLMIDNKTGHLRKTPIAIILAMIIAIFIISMILCVKVSEDLMEITESSIKNDLISTSLAAVEILDIEAFASYESLEDVEADWDSYVQIRQKLRSLAKSVNAEYIYALKKIDGEYYFVFDTDTENEEIFITYDIYNVHRAAFSGVRAADVLNVEDEWGSYNTGAVPIFHDGEVVGIMSVDKADSYLMESRSSSVVNITILAVLLLALLGALTAFLLYLLRKVKDMQVVLRGMAHNDTITGLPNRLYLFEYLNEHMSNTPDVPFALVFIDLDNFKSVNDQAGHDAGDELLRKIAEFLQSESAQATTFHPTAGHLNVSARVGGDEFIQIYPGASTVEDAEAIAHRLFNAFKPAEISRYIEKYNVSLSVGIALYPSHSESYHALIKYADAAMYEAKRSGKKQFRIYSDGMVAEE